jgi:inorganic triphosphatase YgiF
MTRSDKSNPHREIELKLVIVSDSPQSVYDEIGELKIIAGYTLEAQPDVTIRDRYLDGPDCAFRNRRWALRLRTVAGKRLIALKGPAVTTEYGALERPEIEAEWSRKSLIDIAQQAKAIGVDVAVSDALFYQRNPIETLHELGLVTIQDRETVRGVRLILNKREKPAVEMALDHVKYVVKDRMVDHYEIELESVSPEGEELIPRISRELTRIYGNDLRKWSYDKLLLGWVIELLYEQLSSSECIHDGLLTSDSYDRIEAALSRL